MSRMTIASLASMPVLGTITLLIGGAALFAASGPAIAAEPVRTMRVAAGPSELATRHGRAAIEGRIVRAANLVCATDRPRNLKAMAERRACVDKAVAMSRLQIAALLAARPIMAAASPTFPQSPSATSPEEPSVL